MEGVVTRAVFVRALAAVTLLALLSLWVQAAGLFGSGGILPFAEHLEHASGQLGLSRFWKLPTLLWFWPTDLGLNALFALGCALAVGLLVGTPIDGVLLIGLWAVTLSLVVAGQRFLAFQWDSLLVELLFVAALWSPFLPGPRRPPPVWARWLAWWVVFKLFFFGGLVKLTSGDPTWRDGTALLYHYWTQPLPNPVSWYAQQLPDGVHELSVYAMFVIELVLPFFVFLGARARVAVFGPLVGLLGLLMLTGNYGFFQVLGVVACLTLIDDAHWRTLIPAKLLDRLAPATEPARHVGAPVALALFLTSLLFARGYDALPGWGQAWARVAYPFHTANSYGLFAVMTTERPLVVFETSEDGVEWDPLWLPWQTGRVDEMPRQVAPHMPRLDWQIWFAGLGDCRSNPWVLRTQMRLAEGEPAVWALFERELPRSGPPRHVRTTLWRYRFAESGASDWWVREGGQPYCPVVPPVVR